MLASIFGSIIICFIIYKTFILPENISLSIITPNYINFLLLGLCILMHQTFSNFKIDTTINWGNFWYFNSIPSLFWNNGNHD